MCDDDNPYAVPIPDDWEPEQAESVINFLEAVLDRLHTSYDMAIRELWLDRRARTTRAAGTRASQDGDMPF